MSFGDYARKVRDPTLPHRRRVSALRSCVQLYRPIGFHATLSFLAEIAGPYDREEDALLRALEALVASRRLWHADVRQYAQMRRHAKRHGQRCPRPDDRNPSNAPDHWYGAPTPAALHALAFWRRKHLPGLLATGDEVVHDVDACVVAVLASGGRLDPHQRGILADCVAALQRRIDSGLWRNDQMGYFRAWDLLTVARLVETADTNQP